MSDAANGIIVLHKSARDPNPWQVTYSWGAVDAIERLRAELARHE